MMDPYKLLGVSPDATDEEIKQAYHALVRKYHPDKYANTDLADMANEKMKDINAAYEEIQSRRKHAAETASGSYSEDASTQEARQRAQYTYNGTSVYGRVRLHINSGTLDDAAVLLSSVPEQERGGEWHFLTGCVLLRRQYYVDAQNHLDLACRLDPYNSEYRVVRDRLRAQTASDAGGYRIDPEDQSSCSACDLCMSMCCASCCCDCLCDH